MKSRKKRWAKPILFLACLAPFAVLTGNAVTDGLGANPIEEITHFTGQWTLYLLLVTLAITPLRRLTGRNLVRYRRMLGLFSFFYACLHFLTYLVLDQFFDWTEIVRDVLKRPYITVGFSAFSLLIPLAATSTDAMVRRLGRRWKTLHQLVYIAATLGILHYLWLVKADTRDPLIFGAILVTLLLLRVIPGAARRRPRRMPAATS